MSEARAPYLDITLWPNPPLSHKGLMLVMGFFGGLSFVISAFFWSIGAWPVLGFLGLDLAALYWAFRVVERRSHTREYVRLDTRDLIIRHEPPRGQPREARLEPVFARVELERTGKGENRLYLGQGQNRYEIGRFLCTDEREALASEIKRALHTWRGPRI